VTDDRKVSEAEARLGELLERHDEEVDYAEYERWREDPVGFVRQVLREEPWEKQCEIAEAVRDHRQVTVRSCHAAGKDWIAARLALWWVYSRRGRVVVTGPTRAQVEEIIMRGEVRDAFRRGDLPGDLHVKALRPAGEGKAAILAKTATGVHRLSGIHKRLLFVVTEAQDPEIEHAWDAAFVNATGEEDRKLTLGNPTEPDGRFYDAHRPGSDWHSIKVASEDIPNVRRGEVVIPGLLDRAGVEGFASEYGRESAFYRSRVEAEFPAESEDALIEREWLDAAVRRHRREPEPEGYYVVGVDPARFGSDETVCCVRRGGRVMEFVAWRGEDTQASARRVLNLVRRLHDGGRTPVKTVAVDSIGIGAGVVDRVKEDLDTTWHEAGRGGRGLRERRTRVVAFNSAKKAPRPDRYPNVRSQAFWRVRKLLEDGELALPDDPRLLEELRALRVEFTANGLTRIGGKDRIKSRLGRSPDRADALAISLRPDLEEEGALELLIGGASSRRAG
jgi:transcription antitermination factor NusG